jgi:hypothetical protein
MAEVNFRYKNTKNENRIKDAVDYILDKEYGSTILFGQLADIMRYNIQDEQEERRFKSTMNKVRNILVDSGYILKIITGVGYYILKPKHISSYCYRTYVDRTKRLLEKSERVLKHVDQTELSDERKKEHAEMTDLNQQLYGEIGLVVEGSEYGKKRAYYDSLED